MNPQISNVQWTSEDISALNRDLLKLISPFPQASSVSYASKKTDPGFNVEFVAEEFPEYAGAIGKRFLRSSYAVLKGYLRKDGKPAYKLKFRGAHPQTFSPPESRFPQIGLARFLIHFFVYSSDYFAGLDINVRDAQVLGRDQGGVHVYYDRFRIPPYGDPGDDWLKLDEERSRGIVKLPQELTDLAKQARRPMLLVPGNNQLFGAVYLSRFDNPNIRQTLNRERLRENDAFEALRKFVRLGINWMTVMHARAVAEKTQKRERTIDSPVVLLTQAREKVAETTEEITSEKRAEILQAIDLAKAAIEQEHEEHISELSMLRVLASAGTMVVVFEHELLGVLEGLRESHRNLQTYMEKLKHDERAYFRAILDRLRGWIEDAEHHGELLGLLLAGKSRQRRRRLAVRPTVTAVAESFSQYMQDNGIVFEDHLPQGLRTPPMFECELGAILINLMTNALKAVRRARKGRIAVKASGDQKGVSICFLDNGGGAQQKKWRQYFKPFVSESEPDPILGQGIGLGLKIVSDFVDTYGGEAKFTKPARPWRTCVEIRIPEE